MQSNKSICTYWVLCKVAWVLSYGQFQYFYKYFIFILFSSIFVKYKRSNCDSSYQSKKEFFTEISWKKFLDRIWCTNRNIWLIFENADIEIISKCLVATKQVVWSWRSWHWWLKCLIFVFWKQWNEADFSFQKLWGQVQQKSLMSLKRWCVIGLLLVEVWILLHVLDPLAFSEVSKIHWPFKAVFIEGVYDKVSEAEACQMTRSTRRILIGLICQRFKDGIHVFDKVAKGIRHVFRDRKASF